MESSWTALFSAELMRNVNVMLAGVLMESLSMDGSKDTVKAPICKLAQKQYSTN